MPTITLTNNDDLLDNTNVVADNTVDTIVGLDGNDTIIGSQGDDLIYGGNGADSISSNFALLAPTVGGDTVYGGAGDDIITTFNSVFGVSSSVGDTVYGGIGNDSILGAVNSNNVGQDLDFLFGGAGNDTIDGNGGEDSIDAGAGNDTVIARDEVDTTDGGAGIDLIDFSNESGAVTFDMASGATDADGDTESNLNYENAIGSSAADSITGDAQNNSIAGGAGADTLAGGNGSDTFSSGAGDDSITGGEDAGDTDIDVLDYSDETLGVIVTFTGDEAGTAQGIGTGTDTFAEIENIIFTAQDDNVNAAADTVGVNLDTGAGDDFVRAGQGADSMDGGDGVDELSYIDSAAPVTLDLEAGTGTGGNAEGDSFANFENFTLTDGNDSVTGSAASDTVDGGLGDDNIAGGGGDDSVDAGDGNDNVQGGAGDDSMDGGAGIDTLDLSDATGPVTVDLGAGTASSADTGNDTFVNFEGASTGAGDDTITGTAGNDTIDSGAGNDSVTTGDGDDSVTAGDGNDNVDTGSGDDTVDAGAGDDTVGASAGNDSFDGGAGVDTYDASGSTAPVTIDLANNTATGVDIGDDTVVNFEGATGGSGDDTLTGGGGDETLDGGDGNDSVGGGDGNDTLGGGGGNDTIDGGSGNDSIDGGDGTDTIDGGDGNDTIDAGLGDDDINISTGDSAAGGGGDDEFILTTSGLTGTNTITIVGGETDEEDVIDPTNNPAGRLGDTLIINAAAGETFDVLYAGGNDEAGTVNIIDSGGNTISTIEFSEIENIVCFTRGTMIMTPRGEVAIEDLEEGDMVLTRDRGAQPIRWIGSQTVEAKGKLAPVMIAEGALGNDRDLRVSALHRMLITDWRAELMFGEPEVLAAAKHLVNGDTIYVEEGGEVEYFHMLFDNHEIVTANGAPSESFHPGEQGVSWLEEEIREEIFTIFPQLRVDMQGYGPAARTSLKAFEARALKK